jgi:dipeptidase E
MRAYLSSFRLGARPDELLRLLGGGRRVAVVANAIDGPAPAGMPANSRELGVRQEIDDLVALGLQADELDLREYLGGPVDALDRALRAYDALWVRGGNAFMLRAAMSLSGADAVIAAAVAEDAFVYAGYSAGPCVVAPSLRGLELVDEPHVVRDVYGIEPVWEGLGLIDFAFVPHFESPGHPETDDIAEVAALYRRDGTPHRTLHDGQAIVIEDESVTLV